MNYIYFLNFHTAKQKSRKKLIQGLVVNVFFDMKPSSVSDDTDVVDSHDICLYF
jgi:hypothetical protein